MHNSNNKIVIKIKDLYVNDFILGCKVVLFWGLGEVDGLWPPPSNKIYLSIKYNTDKRILSRKLLHSNQPFERPDHKEFSIPIICLRSKIFK